MAALLLYALQMLQEMENQDVPRCVCMTYCSFLDLNSLRVRSGVISERSDERTRKTTDTGYGKQTAGTDGFFLSYYCSR